MIAAILSNWACISRTQARNASGPALAKCQTDFIGQAKADPNYLCGSPVPRPQYSVWWWG